MDRCAECGKKFKGHQHPHAVVRCMPCAMELTRESRERLAKRMAALKALQEGRA